jgi:hypothetical protein
LLNKTNQVTPFGSLTYSQNGAQDVGGVSVPTYTATTNLTPASQAALDSQQKLNQGLSGLATDQLGRIQGNISTPFNAAQQFGPTPTANQADLQRASNAVYNQAKSRLDPQYAQQGEQLDAQLRNQGFTPGTAGYDAAEGNFTRAKNDAYTSAQNQAQATGTQAEAQQYGLSSSAYQQQIANALQQRELPLNEASALRSGTQVASPTFGATPQTGVAPTDVMGAFGLQQSALNNAYNANVGVTNANNQAEAATASAAMMAAASAFA